MRPGGFEALSRPQTYDPENLYEKINGKAPFYIKSGFEKLFTQRFVSKDRESLWIEVFVYDMAGARNAFSVYSMQRRPDGKILSLWELPFGYRTDNALYFVSGKYYIELVGSSKSLEQFEVMAAIARRLVDKLAAGKADQIAELSLFPTENIVPGSIKLYLTETFGFEGLTNTFTARYEIDGETITAFLSKRADYEDAETVAASYRSFLIENGAVTKNTADKTLKNKVFDFYGTVEIVFAIGPFVAGIHEAENQQMAERLAVILAGRLSKSAKTESDDREKR